MAKDLRTHLYELEKDNRLIRVIRKDDPVYELTAVAKKLHKKYGKAVIFETIKASLILLTSFVFPDRSSVASALNIEIGKELEECAVWKVHVEKPCLDATAPLKLKEIMRRRFIPGEAEL